jgi:hypothetical protein
VFLESESDNLESIDSRQHTETCPKTRVSSHEVDVSIGWRSEGGVGIEARTVKIATEIVIATKFSELLHDLMVSCSPIFRVIQKQWEQ